MSGEARRRRHRRGFRGAAAALAAARAAGVLAVGVLAAVVPTAVVPGAAAQDAAAVAVDAARTEVMSGTVPVIGRLVARQAGEIAARAAGPVVALHVEIGDSVEKGDAIASLDTVRLRAQRDRLAAVVAEAEAQVAQSLAQEALRRQALRRIEGLRDSAAFSQGRFEDARQQAVIAETAVMRAEALRASAAANLALAEIDLAWARIEAPYPGVITVLHIQAGAWLGVGAPVASMVNDRDLEVEADVPSERIEALDVGVSVPLALDDGSRHTAAVRAVVPAENAFTRTRQVRFTPLFGPLRKPLAIDQSVTLALPAGRGRKAVTVHKDAIVHDQGQTFVYVARDGRAQIRLVRLGDSVGGRFEVLKGLEAGEPVVVRGNERLWPDRPIVVGAGG